MQIGFAFHSNAKPNELWFALSLADRVKVVLHALDRDKLPVFGALCPGGGATPRGLGVGGRCGRNAGDSKNITISIT